MSIKFIHRRYITTPTLEDKLNGKTYSLSCKGGITVGYTWDVTNKVVRLAVSRCSMDDNFNRRVARDIVMGRLVSAKKGRSTTIDLNDVNITTPQAIEDVIRGWLENQERLWDAAMESYKVH